MENFRLPPSGESRYRFYLAIQFYIIELTTKHPNLILCVHQISRNMRLLYQDTFLSVMTQDQSCFFYRLSLKMSSVISTHSTLMALKIKKTQKHLPLE